jgi:hypothetical protein
MNKGILAIGGLAGLGLLKRFGGLGSGNVSSDTLVKHVCQKLSTVVELSRDPYENESMVSDVILGFINERHFNNMIENLNAVQLSEYNDIFYYEMSKETFKKLIGNYLKNISMWFGSDFVDLGPSDFDVKRAWFTDKGKKRISLLENSLYERNFFYIYDVFKKLPFIEENETFAQQATLTAKVYISGQINEFKNKKFIDISRASGTYDNYTTFVPSIYNPDSGFDIVEQNPNNYPRTFNILDRSLTTVIPKVVASFTMHKPLWDNILKTDFSHIGLPIWMPPYELHYLFMNASVDGVFFRTRISPVKLWSKK